MAGGRRGKDDRKKCIGPNGSCSVLTCSVPVKVPVFVCLSFKTWDSGRHDLPNVLADE